MSGAPRHLPLQRTLSLAYARHPLSPRAPRPGTLTAQPRQLLRAAGVGLNGYVLDAWAMLRGRFDRVLGTLVKLAGGHWKWRAGLVVGPASRAGFALQDALPLTEEPNGVEW